MMKRVPNQKGWDTKKSYWGDFTEFLKATYPEVKTMRDVTEKHSKAYVSHLRTKGKFKKLVSYKGRTYESPITKLAESTVNEYIIQLRQIFRIMAATAGLVNNPFSTVSVAINRKKSRDVFEIEELVKINDYFQKCNRSVLSKSEQLDFDITRAIFIIGINTGLRRGDICLLKWDDINFHRSMITKEVSKTRENVCIPMTQTLYDFIQERYQRNGLSEYVVPELAQMYKENQEGTTYRFKKMLESLDITTTKSFDDRSRKTSVKDIHSLRHTFCYLHGFQGTPLVTVQSMVGHMSSKMTEAYTMHKTEQSKRDAIERFSFGSLIPDSLKDKKNEIMKLVAECNDADKLDRVIDTLKYISLSPPRNDSDNQHGRGFKL